MPLQSQICTPKDGTTIPKDQASLLVKGYALSSGGKGISRVDLSVNDQYQPTDLTHSKTVPQSEHFPQKRNWSWSLWAATVPAQFNENGEMTICANAIDRAGNSQPNKPIWNVRGFGCNAIDCITVKREN